MSDMGRLGALRYLDAQALLPGESVDLVDRDGEELLPRVHEVHRGVLEARLERRPRGFPPVRRPPGGRTPSAGSRGRSGDCDPRGRPRADAGPTSPATSANAGACNSSPAVMPWMSPRPMSRRPHVFPDIPRSARAFCLRLAEERIPHVCEAYAGGHEDRLLERIPSVHGVGSCGRTSTTETCC